jgi:hypothetical protein
MITRLAIVAETTAILAAVLLASNGAQAGGSVSAPSKYGQSKQVAAYPVRTQRQARRSDFPITEYSSSSAKTHAPNR